MERPFCAELDPPSVFSPPYFLELDPSPSHPPFVMLCATGGLNLCRFDMLAERILLIFAPVLTPNGDQKAFVTAHAPP